MIYELASYYYFSVILTRPALLTTTLIILRIFPNNNVLKFVPETLYIIRKKLHIIKLACVRQSARIHSEPKSMSLIFPTSI